MVKKLYCTNRGPQTHKTGCEGWRPSYISFEYIYTVLPLVPVPAHSYNSCPFTFLFLSREREDVNRWRWQFSFPSNDLTLTVPFSPILVFKAISLFKMGLLNIFCFYVWAHLVYLLNMVLSCGFDHSCVFCCYLLIWKLIKNFDSAGRRMATWTAAIECESWASQKPWI